MVIYYEKFYHAQKLQKQAHDKGVKSWSYPLGGKVWFNSKYIKTKRNCMLKAMFFGPFQVFHLIGKQAYKLELPRNWRIHNVFYMSLLEQHTIRKGREFSVPEFEPGDNKKYEVEAIQDSIVYANEVDGHLLELYYLVAWKSYLDKENIWEPFLVVMHLQKMVSTFHKGYLKKPTVT